MTSRYGLSDVEWYQILNVFSNTEQIEEVILFGSRAMGTHRPASDIDIAIKGSQLNLSIQHALEWMLDDLLLPYKFDLVNRLVGVEEGIGGVGHRAWECRITNIES